MLGGLHESSSSISSDYVPVKLKLQHPPPGKPRAFDCTSLPWNGGEFEPDLPLVLAKYAREFLRFLQSLTDFQDRIHLC